MKTDLEKYLSGESFSNGYNYIFSNYTIAEHSRIDVLSELVTGKNVIHVGCCDHLPLIPQKIKQGKWLHKILTDRCNNCIGIDINAKAVEYVRNVIGYDNVTCNDICDNTFELPNQTHWDYILLGEIIEHIEDPYRFIKSIREKFIGKIDKIIITAPNVFNIDTERDIKKGIENINTDHVFWFSPYTLQKIAYKAGYRNFTLHYGDRLRLPLHEKIWHKIHQLCKFKSYYPPTYFNSIILIADL